MIGMVIDSKLAAHQFSDAPARPKTGGEAKCQGTLQHHLHQVALLPRRQLGRAARRRLGLQALAARLTMGAVPSAHRAPVYAEAGSHLVGLQTPFQQLNRSQTPLLKLARTAVWTHILPPWWMKGA
jgi:hypothetical protein